MAVSYLISLEQLSVLAHFSYNPIDHFPLLPDLPKIDRAKSEKLLDELKELGMLHKRDNEAALDITIGFILSTMAKPDLLIETEEGGKGYCTRALGVVVKKDSLTPNKYRITPLPTGEEMANILWEEKPNYESLEALREAILKVYKEDGHG